MITEKHKVFRGGSSPAPASAAPAQSNSTTVNSQPWAPAQPYIVNGMQQAANLSSQGPQQYTPFSQVANLDPLQQQAMQGTRDYVNAPGTQNFMNTASNGVQNMMSGAPNQVQQVAGQGLPQMAGFISNNNMYDPAQATNQMAYGNNMNPYLKGQVDSALRQLSNNFQTNTLPGLRRGAIGDNTYGSSRNEMAEGQAAGALSRDMYNTTSQMYGNAYNTEQQNALQALGLSGNQQLNQAQLANGLFNYGNGLNLDAQNIGLTNYGTALNAPLSLLQAQGQVGNQQYNQNQANITDAANRWNFNQNAPWNNVANFKNMIDPNTTYGGAGASSGYQSQPMQPVNNAALATSGLLSGAGLAASFMK